MTESADRFLVATAQDRDGRTGRLQTAVASKALQG